MPLIRVFYFFAVFQIGMGASVSHAMDLKKLAKRCLSALNLYQPKPNVQLPENAIIISCNSGAYCQYNSLKVLQTLKEQKGFSMAKANILISGQSNGGHEHVVVEYNGFIYDARLRTDNIVVPQPLAQYFSDNAFVDRSIVRIIPGQEYLYTMPYVEGDYYFRDIRFRELSLDISKKRPLIPLRDYLNNQAPTTPDKPF